MRKKKVELNVLCMPEVYFILHIASYISKHKILHSALLTNRNITPFNQKSVIKSAKCITFKQPLVVTRHELKGINLSCSKKLKETDPEKNYSANF